jgi:hypothetical protein
MYGDLRKSTNLTYASQSGLQDEIPTVILDALEVARLLIISGYRSTNIVSINTTRTVANQWIQLESDEGMGDLFLRLHSRFPNLRLP